MWGVIAGLVLKSNREPMRKVKLLVFAGLICVVLGFALDPITPIIKRICTSSFIIISGGWCLLVLALFFWIIDVKGYRKWSRFIIIFGMNPIFIYMFSQLLGKWMKDFIGIFSSPFLVYFGVAGKIIQVNLYLAVLWYLAYWLYTRKILIRI